MTKEPQAIIALTELGIMLRKIEQPNSAASTLGEALRLSPNNVEARVQMALLRAERGEFEPAISTIQAVMEDDPLSAEHYNDLAAIEWRRGAADKAMLALEKALDVNPQYAQAHRSLGELRQEKTELRAALAAYDRSIELDAASARAWYKRGTVLEALGSAAWIDSMRRAIELGGLQENARMTMFVLLFKAAIGQHQQGRVSEAAPLFELANCLDVDSLELDPRTVREFDYFFAQTMQLLC